MVKKTGLIIIIAIFLVAAGVCGYALINGIEPGYFLKDSGIYPFSTETSDTDTLGREASVQQDPETVPSLNQRSFETAINKLYILDSEDILDLENITYHQIVARFVGSDGLADSWIIGARQNGNNILLSYNSGEWTEMEWPGPLPEEIIELENITCPEDLYSKNSAIIAEYFNEANVSKSDLSLSDGIYTITIQKENSIVELKFKGDTGELI